MKNSPPVNAGSLAHVIDAALAEEFTRLVIEHMAKVEATFAPLLRWSADYDELSEVIGDHYAYRILRSAKFVPGERGIWQRPPRTSDPAELAVTEHLEVGDVAKPFRIAAKALDPMGLCRPLFAGQAA